MQRNVQFSYLPAKYLFPEIQKKKAAFLLKNPHAELISLGIGDTTEPISPYIAKGLEKAAKQLATLEGYRGYGPDQGLLELRELISHKIYQQKIDPNDIFISDGTKCDIGRLQMVFGPQAQIALQDPAYPVYLDTSLLTAYSDLQGCINPSRITFLPCLPHNDFFPDIELCQKANVLILCSPNNPTGSVLSKEQLKKLVALARKNKQLIVFDAAYSLYIQDREIPRSIYEISGAEEVAIELGSFSKMAGFTGVRLGWSVVPSSLKFDDGTLVQDDWSRINTTFFNGASHISQKGGVYALSEQGYSEMERLCSFYMENCTQLRHALESRGYPVYGGIHAPYLWVYFGKRSWETFEEILERCHIVTTPGSGFGPSGEGFIRFSAYGHKATIKKAADRLYKLLPSYIQS